jgi:hypothetical protein
VPGRQRSEFVPVIQRIHGGGPTAAEFSQGPPGDDCPGVTVQSKKSRVFLGIF